MPATQIETDVVADSVRAYSDHIEEYTSFNQNAIAEIAAQFAAKFPAGAHVLDAGCGPGRDLARFAAAGLNPVGVDLNPHFVYEASAHAPTHLGDLRELPFPADTFDGVWACASLVHLPFEDAAVALAQPQRVAKPGALVYVSVKHAGETGWAQTAHGRRWFQMWDADAFAALAATAGLTVAAVVQGPVFLDLWASA